MFELLGQRGFFRLVEELDDGRFPFAFFHLDIGQAFRAETLGVFGHRFDLALRGASQAFGVERLDHPAVAMAPLKTLNVLARNSSVKSTSSMPKRVSGLSMP